MWGLLFFGVLSAYERLVQVGYNSILNRYEDLHLCD